MSRRLLILILSHLICFASDGWSFLSSFLAKVWHKTYWSHPLHFNETFYLFRLLRKEKQLLFFLTNFLKVLISTRSLCLFAKIDIRKFFRRQIWIYYHSISLGWLLVFIFLSFNLGASYHLRKIYFRHMFCRLFRLNKQYITFEIIIWSYLFFLSAYHLSKIDIRQPFLLFFRTEDQIISIHIKLIFDNWIYKCLLWFLGHFEAFNMWIDNIVFWFIF